MVAINCREISKYYKKDKILALDKLDFQVEKNIVFGFLGPNGSGKTTTIKILTGLMQPTGGHAFVGRDEVCLNSFRLRSKIGYLSQNPVYYKWMTGKELLLFVGKLFGLRGKENKKRADKLLELSGLKEAANQRIGGYSGGMIQRLGIAQALVNRPEVLFLDEPCSALDPLGRKEVLEFISGISDTTSVLMSTHILADVERVCDVVGIINKGKMVLLDKMQNIKRQFAQPILELEFADRNSKEQFVKISSKMDWSAAMTIKDNQISIPGEDLSKTRNRVLKLIADQKLALLRMEIKSADLEDVFLK
jgi:ABC-2 type transport system ATP-binding protein